MASTVELVLLSVWNVQPLGHCRHPETCEWANKWRISLLPLLSPLPNSDHPLMTSMPKWSHKRWCIWNKLGNNWNCLESTTEEMSGQVACVQKHSSAHLQPPLDEGGHHRTDLPTLLLGFAIATLVLNELFLVLRWTGKPCLSIWLITVVGVQNN